MLTVRNIPDEGAEERLKFGLLYPVPARTQDSILLEDRDGAAVERLVARSLTSYINGEQVVSLEHAEIAVWITDARLTVACSRYNVGDKPVRVRHVWLPPQDLQDVVGDVVDRVVGKALEGVFNRLDNRIERQAKMLVAQFRYPWIRSAGSMSRSTGGAREVVVLEARLDEDSDWRLELSFPDSSNAAEIAADITRRAARFRLAVDQQIGPVDQSELVTLASAAPLVPAAPDTVASHDFPKPWEVTDASAALLGLPADTASKIEEGIEARPLSSADVLGAIEVMRQIETGEAEVQDPGPLVRALASVRFSDLDELAPTIAFLADIMAQQVSRERREVAVPTVLPRVCEIIHEQHDPSLILDTQVEQALARLIRVWFVSARTTEERLEFLARYWEDVPSADELRGTYVVTLVVAAAMIAAAADLSLNVPAS